MIKFIAFLFTIIFFIVSCKKTSLNQGEIAAEEDLMTTTQIDAFIKSQCKDAGHFEWNTASDVMVWSALQHSDNVMAVGYKPETEANIDNRIHLININDAAWKAVKEKAPSNDFGIRAKVG